MKVEIGGKDDWVENGRNEMSLVLHIKPKYSQLWIAFLQPPLVSGPVDSTQSKAQQSSSHSCTTLAEFH